MTILKEFISNITTGVSVTDILDILVVAFLIYKILGFISNSRAEQLVKGLGLLIAAFFASQALHMYMLNWLLRSTLNIGLIALVVIFQPELRRGLEHLARGSIFPTRAQLEKTDAKRITDEFVKAIDGFSATRTGALIVIEQEVTLGDIAETGTVIDAEISAEMIGNIFYKGAPLHDGAAIVRGDRIHAAGCVLPLTASLDLNKELGTRHRAAIGITENSDAVVLIVSEENGVISVARGGRLRRFLDAKEVEKLLLNLYLKPEDETGRFSWLKKLLGGGKKDA